MSVIDPESGVVEIMDDSDIPGGAVRYRYQGCLLDGTRIDLTAWGNRYPTDEEFLSWTQHVLEMSAQAEVRAVSMDLAADNGDSSAPLRALCVDVPREPRPTGRRALDVG